MSWWDTTGLTSLATQALKTAQKRIDKVLDIKEEEEEIEEMSGQVEKGGSTFLTPTTLSSFEPSESLSSSGKKSSGGVADSFFSTWLTPTLGGNTRLGASSDSTHSEQSVCLADRSSTSPRQTPVGVASRYSESRSETSLSALGQRPVTSLTGDDSVIPPVKLAASHSSTFLEPVSIDVGQKSPHSHDRQPSSDRLLITADHSPTSSLDHEPTDRRGRRVGQKDSMSTGQSRHSQRLFVADKDENSASKVTPCVLTADDTGTHTGCAKNTRVDKTVSTESGDVGAAAVARLLDDLSVGDTTSGWTDMADSQLLTSSVMDMLSDDGTTTDQHATDLLVEGTSIEDVKMEALEEVTAEEVTAEEVTADEIGSDVSEKTTSVMTDSSQTVVSADSCAMLREVQSSEGSLETSVHKVPSSEGSLETSVHKVPSSEGSLETSQSVSIRDVPSLEGSVETSADELSEGNKTLIGDDADVHCDDTDIDEITKLDSVASEANFNTEAGQFEEQEMGSDFPTAVEEFISSEEVRDAVCTGGETSPQSTESNGSYVKNLLEEAMAENSQRDSAGSSDPVRTESGGNSGHTSADEIDTTTSSDIEVISHTSATGPASAAGHSRPFDVSPRHWNVSSGRVHGGLSGLHRRSDSGSSAQSLQSRTEEDFASPEQQQPRHLLDSDSHVADYNSHKQTRDSRRHSARNDSEFPAVTYDVEKLLKGDNRELAKKLAEMAEILEAREKKQLELSHENMDLIEHNNDLRSRLLQLEQSCESECRSVREEFTQRVNEVEKRLQTTLRERDALKASLREAEQEIARRSENIVSEKLLKEKDQMIAEIMQEGEKLSKKQLQNSNTIKKLRTKEKENETLIISQKQKIDEQKADIERLEHILDTKVDAEKKNIDAVNQLNSLVKTQEDEINRLKSELEDAQEKYRSSKVTLDNAYKEISELHKARVTHVSEAQKAALDLEVAAKEQLKTALDELKQQTKREKEVLITQMEDLQLCLSRMEKEHGRREDILRQEISDVQQRLQEAEERNQELTQSVSGVTRPLLRQIENLQSTFAAQTASYERVEKNLTDRLVEAQSQLATATENERFASEKLMETNVRLSSLESQISSLRQERSRLLAELEVERTKVELVEEAKSNETAQRDATRQKLELELSELKKEKMLLENQLEMEKMKVETGKKKVALLHDQLHEKDVQLQLRSAVNPSPTFSREDSIKSDISAAHTTATLNSSQSGDVNEKMLLLATAAVNGNRMSLYDSLRQSSSASSLIESLQSELKQREGEIQQLQSEIAELERTRESMARELVNLCLQNEDLTQKLSEHSNIQQQYTELDQRYNALLQMYGEKVEEAQELQLDLQDVKDMYKSQIDELLRSKSSTSLRNH